MRLCPVGKEIVSFSSGKAQNLASGVTSKANFEAAAARAKAAAEAASLGAGDEAAKEEAKAGRRCPGDPYTK
ncbi:hypothetical protein NFJ02_12g09540 [Pycnococcus provasolii]